MCNHYERSAQGTEEAVQRAVAKMNAKVADEFKSWREQTYPKYTAGIIRQEKGERELVGMRWGIWPFYQREKPQFITNTRSDSLLTKTIWKNSAKKRRCLIPAVAYYEPGLGPPGRRGEVRFASVERSWFFIAGLYDQDLDGSGTLGFTMVTTEPNTYAAKYHDRMPVVLSDAEALAWVGDEPLADDALLALCRGLPAEHLTHTEIAAAPKGKITTADLNRAIATPGEEQKDLFA